MCSNASPPEPSPAAAWRNWNQQMPWREKIKLGWRNTRIKIVTHSTCCGHPGEPGC